MTDTHLVPRHPGSLASTEGPSGPLAPSAIPIDIPGAGLKRDYAGVLEYWQMVRRHKLAVILMTIAGALIGFTLTLSEPRMYQARTTLEIQGLNDEFLDMKRVSPTTSDTGINLDTDIQTQVRIIQSRVLLTRVSEKLNARPHPENMLPSDRLGMWRKALRLNAPSQEQLWSQALGSAAGGVRVRSSGTNRIIELSCESTSPQVAADFCNTLTQEYIDQNLEARWKVTEYTGQWLTRQLQDLKVKLEKQEDELQRYARVTGLVFTGDKEKSDSQETKLGDLQKELSSAQADRINKQSKFEMATSSPAGALPDVLDDPTLKGSQQQLADLNAKLAQLAIVYTPTHAEVRKVQVQIAAIESTLEASRGNILTRIRKEFEGAQRREALLASAYAGQAKTVSGQSEQRAHYSLLKRDVDATRLLYDTLLQRLKEASIASALRANNIRVVDPAERSGIPYKPDVRQRITVGIIFGLMIGVGLTVLRERADRTLQDPGDITYFLGVPELGVVPISDVMDAPRAKGLAAMKALPGGRAPAVAGTGHDGRVELVSFRQKTSLLAESFRTTLTSILFSRRSGDRPHVLVLTSASPKEGKTTVVSNLAISVAEIGHRVLVIDADMRRPRQHGVFNVKNDFGLSDLLMQNDPLEGARFDGACVPTDVPGLFVMASGGSRRNASSLLHSARLPEVLALAREKFDTVIVDTPPMVNIADARVLGRYGDALILVVRSGVTTRDAALLAKARFAEDGIPLTGTILNFWNPKTPGYSYYRYYYAGYYHYYGQDSTNGQGPDEDDGSSGEGGTPERRPRPGSDVEVRRRHLDLGLQFREHHPTESKS